MLIAVLPLFSFDRDDPVERRKVQQYAEETVIGYLDDDFRGHFRMTRECAEGLVNQLATHGTWPEENGLFVC